MSQSIDRRTRQTLERYATQGVIDRSETPLADIPDQNEKPVHKFLLRQYERQVYHPAAVAAHLKMQVEDLPKGKATFKFYHFSDKLPFSTRSITKEALHMTGAWEANNHYTGGSSDDSTSIYANPNHYHAARYSDAIVRCECGTLIVRDKTVGEPAGGLPHDEVDNHRDDCLTHWRYEARAKLLRNRKRIIEQMAYVGHKGSDMFNRLGLTQGKRTISHMTKGLGVNVADLKNDYYERRNNTIVELLPVFNYEQIGYLYDISPRRVKKLVREMDNDLGSSDFDGLHQRNELAVDNDEVTIPTPTE